MTVKIKEDEPLIVEFQNNEEFKSMIDEAVAKSTESLKESMRDFAITASPENELRVKAEKEVNDTFKLFKSLLNKDFAAAREISNEYRGKAMSEGTDNVGGYFVPPAYASRVYEKLDEYSVLRQDADVIPVGTDTLMIPTSSAGLTAYIIGENTSITASDPTLGQATLSVVKYAVRTEFSLELLQDSTVNLLDYLANKAAIAIARKEAAEIINGSTSGREGIMQVTGVGSHTLAVDSEFADLSHVDLLKTAAELGEYSPFELDRAKLYMSASVYFTLLEAREGSGTGQFLAGTVSEKPVRSLWGFPVVLLPELPALGDTDASTKFAFLADLSQHLVIADRTGLEVDVDYGGVHHDKYQGSIRTIRRSGHKIVNPSGIIVISTGASS